ncbi:uncharacterized protein [Temnothorax nylanderi]|uniref:uncharacterized protein n=1 Tax=Temnothorax nylanderi TaxID=102681 RepID=UPI003A840336
MSLDQSAMLNSQHELYVRISKAVDNLKKMGQANINLSAIETRIRILDDHWAKFESQHDLVRACYKDRYAESEYAKSDLLDLAESAYVLQRSVLSEQAKRFKAAAAPTSVPASEQGSERAPKTSLPRINLPHFSGAYEDWPSFRDLFQSVIGQNSAISNVERLHYLRSCLKGPAEKLIRSLNVTGDNYGRAWAILGKHYENKRELIRSNFATFTAVAKMKGDTAEELSRIFNAVTTAVNAQENIGRPIESHGMDLFNHLVVELFDPRTRLEWESSICDSVDPPNHTKLTDFITKRTLTLNAAKPKPASKVSESSRSAKTHVAKHSSDLQCALCKGKHTLMTCHEFKAKPASERKSFVETTRLCYNCLGNHLIAKCQSTKTCLTCKSRHHTMLHEAQVTVPKPAETKPAEVSALSAVRQADDSKAILLATARVIVADRYGEPHAARALIDQGSEVSIISESLAQQLRLKRSYSAVSIFGIGGSKSGSTRGKVTVNLTSNTTGSTISAVAFVLPRLSLYQGSTTRRAPAWPHIQGLPLADPQFLDNDPVEILLGAEVCSTIFEDGIRKGGPQTPIAKKTVLGWILSGGGGATEGHRSSLQCTADHELVDLVRRFWEQETDVSSPAALTPEEKECEEIFVRTHERTATGRYVVRLPFRKAPTSLAETRKPAERLLSTMERRCDQDSRFGELYRAFMQEYEDLQHMTEVSSSNDNATGKCYLPHHGVFKEASSTTKLRVVFNGSQRTKSGELLNSHLHVGANLLPALADVITRWRRYRVALVSDIKQMYRQILVHPKDRGFQRILWRRKLTELLRELLLNTVTYGLACSPFLAIRSLIQLANDEKARYPQGAVALLEDRYVDDIQTGTDTIPGAIALQTELRELCMAGGFPLRKWSSNCEEALEGIPREHRLFQEPHSWQSESQTTLGLLWYPSEDSFAFVIHPRTITQYTKRRVLAETARLFDPLGWLAPVIIRAKILIQSAWLQQLDWDTPLPSSDAHRWELLFKELPSLEGLRVTRWLGTGAENQHLESKVAPVKQVSLARLELCAAASLTDLVEHYRTTLSLSTAPVFLWSDSKTTLQWIRGHSSRWKTFVANRVAHIQLQLPDAQWRHVPGRDNPADCASRGIAPSELLHHPLWWTGPAWLQKDSSHWPNEDSELPADQMPEQRVVVQAAEKVEAEPDMLLRFSSLHRLLRVTAWCSRWRHSAARTALTLQPDEVDKALSLWLRVVQRLHYAAEVTAVTSHRTVPLKSPLVSLNPFLDNHGVLRVGGRLKHAPLAHDEKHPMIAPPSSWLTRLLIDSCHRRTLHGGVQLTRGLLRLRFWIPRGRTVVKQMLHRCVTCTRWRASTPQPPMGNLPRGRVTPARPFLRTGLDYAGPILIRTSRGRGHKAHKAFIAVFVCLCSKAVHLNVVSDYTTDAFLAAFRRFTARRGLCEEVYSDCGTNFVGADRVLQDLFRASSADGRRIANFATFEGVKWHFNPPAAPHFGGLWEAAVKSTKHHLKRVIGESTLTFEEMSTFLAQVEACLNSRPLQALSDDPDDISALTPGHFLIGAPLLAVPEPSLEETADGTLSRWQHIQKMRDHFWSRWSRKYIHGMTARPKWHKTEDAPDVGALCLVRSEITPPSRWPLARIVQLHPGDDGVVRVATIRTSTSELVRPLCKLVLLPWIKDQPPPTDA